MKGHKGAAKDDKSIRTRLTPELVLASAGTGPGDSYMPIGFSSDSYTLLYRIWGNHQKLRFQNKNMGFLEIKKEQSEGFKNFSISRVLVNSDNMNLHIAANLKTLDDEFNTPVHFSWRSRVTDNALCIRPELTIERSGRIESGRVIETIGGKEYMRAFSGCMVFDFTVYDFVLRGIEMTDFTFFENMYSFKSKNRLFTVDRCIPFKDYTLRPMIQLGNGLTERIFYRDNSGIPIITVQNSAAYILDTVAKEKTSILMEELNTGGVHYEY